MKKMDVNGVSMTTFTADYEQFGFNDEQERAKKKYNKDATLCSLKDTNCESCLLCTKKNGISATSNGDECYCYFISTIAVNRFHKFKGFHK